jgi:hypothetical protein
MSVFTFTKKTINSKQRSPLKELLAPLEELDTLCELFSFFTSVTVDNSRSTCRWWNDLLSKDKQAIRYTSKNKDGKEALLCLHGEVKRFYNFSEPLLNLKSKIRSVSHLVDGKTAKIKKNKKIILEMENLLMNLQGENEYFVSGTLSSYLIHPTVFKQGATIITKIINGMSISFYVKRFMGPMYIETNYSNFVLVRLNESTHMGIEPPTSAINNKRFNSGQYFIIDSGKVSNINEKYVQFKDENEIGMKERLENFLVKDVSSSDWIFFDFCDDSIVWTPEN